jgi:hypothetical protein
MSCASTDRLLQSVRVHVPGVTDAMLNLETFNVLDEFFRRTSAWQLEIPIELVEDQTEYAFPTPINSEVVRVIGVSHNNIPVAAAGSQGALVQSSLGVVQSELVFPDGDVNVAPDLSNLDLPSGVFSWAIYRPDYLSISTPADEEQRKYPMVIGLALTVGKSCLEEDCEEWDVPEWMWSTYFQDWYDGCLARLYAMPAKPWASPVHAQYHGKRFRNAMAYRKQEVPRGFAWAQPGPWRFPRGW